MPGKPVPFEDVNKQIIDEFRANEGRVGGRSENMTLLLLHQTGAKSGIERVIPLVYMAQNGSYVLIASLGGAPHNPAWYFNLKANPDVAIEVGTERINAVAAEATGAERDRLFQTMADQFPIFHEYQTKTDRVLPVIVLSPR